jgi:hypothetical protein
MADAKLYTVKTQRSEVYALQDLSTGMIWTERSDYSARQLARERRLTITQEESVSHEQLLRMMGHEPPPVPKSATSTAGPALVVDSVDPIEPLSEQPTAPVPAAPLSSSGIAIRYHWEDEDQGSIAPTDDTIIIPRRNSTTAKNVFFSDGPVNAIPPGTMDVSPRKSEERK